MTTKEKVKRPRRKPAPVDPDSKRGKLIQARLIQIPASYQRAYKRAVAGTSPKAALKSMCLECVAWKRDEVARCTALACPLYALRPFQSGERS